MEVNAKQPLVTIALSVFNGGATLHRAIQSVLSQTYKNFELVVIDDRSTDNSVSIARSFKDKRVRVIVNKINIGHSACLNKVVKVAAGKYLARMDQDDICFSNRIEKQVEYMLNNPDVDLLATATLVFNHRNEILGVLPVKTDHEDICRKPLSGFYLPHPTWMGHIEWFRSNPYNSDADGAEDQDLLFRSHKSSRFACLSEPLLAYKEGRRHLRRMWRSRFIFAKSAAKQAWRNDERGNSFRICIMQFAKVFGDILNVYFRIPSMRNVFSKPDTQMLLAWENMRREYHIR